MYVATVVSYVFLPSNLVDWSAAFVITIWFAPKSLLVLPTFDT
jgi:hypothetical protein